MQYPAHTSINSVNVYLSARVDAVFRGRVKKGGSRCSEGIAMEK